MYAKQTRQILNLAIARPIAAHHSQLLRQLSPQQLNSNNLKFRLATYSTTTTPQQQATKATSSATTNSQQQDNSKMADKPESAQNVYQFHVKDLDGNDVSMDKYKGKVLLIVNTASNCGLTKSNIKGLIELQDKYKGQDVQVLGFPSNSFNQELTCETDIKEFVKKNNINFDYFSKIAVNGDETDPLYKYLKAKQGGVLGNFIKWNYSKFLVDKNGIPVKRYSPTTSPADIEKDIDQIKNQ